jgi:hypothetical protein
VLAAPQLVVLGIEPVRRDGAVDQAHSTPGPGRWPRPQSARTSPPRPARSARLATKLKTVSGEISRKELLRTVLPKIRAISVARYNPHDFGRPLPCSTARSTHCALVAPAPASATTSDRWYGDGNGSPGRREFSGRISRILPREPLPSVATRRSPTTFLASGCAC